MAVIFASNRASDFGGLFVPYTGTPQSRDAANPEELRMNIRYIFNFDGVFPSFSPSGDELFVHFRMKTPPGIDSGGADGHLLQAFDSNGNITAQLDMDNGQIRAVAVSTAGPGAAISPETVYTFDMHIVADGTDVTTTLYLDGVSVSTVTTSSTRGVPNDITLTHNDITGSSAFVDCYYSEFILDDADSTVGCRLFELTPSADGFHTDFTGDYEDIQGPTGLIFSDTVGDRQSWDPTAYNGVTASASIRAVCAVAKAYRGDSAPGALSNLLRVGSVSYTGTPTNIDTRKQTPVFNVWQSNPDDSSAWLFSDLTSIEVGIEISL